MTRREFAKSLLITFLPLMYSKERIELETEMILLETGHLSDADFVTYVSMQINYYIGNPGKCARITNIEEL